MSSVWSRLLRSFGRLSFGVYLIHPMVIWWFERFGFDYITFNSWFAIPVLMLLVVLVSSAIVWLLQKIPVVKMIVP